MSGAGDLLGTLGAVAPSALAGYTRGQTRALQYQAQQQQLQQQLLLRQLAQHLQQQQYDEQTRHNKATEAQGTAQLAATQAEKAAALQAEHRRFLENAAYGPGAEERLYGMQQSGVLPAFFGMLHEAGVPLPFGEYQPPGMGEVTRQPPLTLTSAPARIAGADQSFAPQYGPALTGVGPIVPGLGAGPPAGEYLPAERGYVEQPPVTEKTMLPARIKGETPLPKPSKVLAEESLAGLRAEQAKKAAEENVFLAATKDARIKEALAKGDLAAAQARYEQIRPELEQRRVAAQESTANSLAGYRSGMLGESQANRASREAIEAANRASRETIAGKTLAIQRALLPDRQKHLRALTTKAERSLTNDFSPAEKDELKTLDKQLFTTQTVKEGLQSRTTYLEPPQVREQALRRKLEIYSAHGYEPPDVGGGGGAGAGGGTTKGLTLSPQEINHAAAILDQGPAAVSQRRATYRAAGGDALRAFDAAVAEVQRRRAGKRRK
jgi:hypothetical protein